MALTKSLATALGWTAVAVQSIQATAVISVANNYETTLHIDCAATTTIAHTGTEIIVQIRGEAVDDAWTTLTRFTGPAVTPISLALTSDVAQGVTSLVIALVTTFKTFGRFIIIKDATLDNSEIAYVKASTSTGLMTLLDNTTHAHATTAVIYGVDAENIAGEVVATYPVAIPFSATETRVLFNNNYDTAAAEATVRVKVSKVTALV
jgi:hypothetical protein